MLGIHRHEGELLDQVHAAHCGKVVVMAWDARDAGSAKVRVLRSARDYAEGPNDVELLPMDQTLVYEGTAGDLTDDGILPSADSYFYTIYGQTPDGAWHEQLHAELAPGAELHWSRDEAAEPGPSLGRLAELRRAVTSTGPEA
jgi:hypothetical protein